MVILKDAQGLPVIIVLMAQPVPRPGALLNPSFKHVTLWKVNGDITFRQLAIHPDLWRFVDRPEVARRCFLDNKEAAMTLGEHAAKTLDFVRVCQSEQNYKYLTMSLGEMEYPSELLARGREFHDEFVELIKEALVSFGMPIDRATVVDDPDAIWALNEYVGYLKAYAAIRNVWSHAAAVAPIDTEAFDNRSRLAAYSFLLRTGQSRVRHYNHFKQ